MAIYFIIFLKHVAADCLEVFHTSFNVFLEHFTVSSSNDRNDLIIVALVCDHLSQKLDYANLERFLQIHQSVLALA